jgi:hypothetical protein
MKKVLLVVLLLAGVSFAATWAAKINPKQDQTSNADWVFSDVANVYFGSDKDWRIECDTTKTLEFIPLAGDESYTFNIGADTAGADLKAFGATTSKYMLWDASADKLIVAGYTDLSGGVLSGASPLVFDGATATGTTNRTTLAVTDPTAARTITLPDKSGTVKLASAAVPLTPGAAVTLTVGQGNLYTDTIVTDNEDQTITFSGAGTAGDVITILFITDAAGSGDEVITFHSALVSSTGTLTLANGVSQAYTVTFISNGSKWYEIARTAVQQ